MYHCTLSFPFLLDAVWLLTSILANVFGLLDFVIFTKPFEARMLKLPNFNSDPHINNVK